MLGGREVLALIASVGCCASHAGSLLRLIVWPITHILNLVLVQRRYAIDDHPRQTPPKVHHLMHEETHNPRRQDIISNERVPGGPHALESVEVHIVLGNGVVLVPVGVLGVRQHHVRDRVVRRIVAGREHSQLGVPTGALLMPLWLWWWRGQGRGRTSPTGPWTV